MNIALDEITCLYTPSPENASRNIVIFNNLKQSQTNGDKLLLAFYCRFP